MAEQDPFAALGIAPTLDAAQVKRAYFAALQHHPPHQDPSGFRRLRAVYEALSSPDGLAAAWLAAPLDIEAELARYAARYDEPLAALAAEHRRAQQAGQAGDQFLELVSRLSWEQALARFGAHGFL